MAACHSCGTEFVVHGIVSRSATCGGCHAYLRSCANCEYFDARAKNECREVNAEPVGDKKASNFCEYFAPNRRSGRPVAAGDRSEPKKGADDAFAALFKK